MADEWPQSVNPRHAEAIHNWRRRGSGGLPRRECVLANAGRCTHIPRARQVRVLGRTIMGGWILLAVVVVVVWFVVSLYNRLVGAA